MRHVDEPAPEEVLEAYLDGALNPTDRAAFEMLLSSRPDLRQQVELQKRIDASLAHTFAPPMLSNAENGSFPVIDESAGPPVTLPAAGQGKRTRRRLAILAAAAACGWIVIGWQLLEPGRDEPLFRPRPLMELYRETLASGFEPYYECHEADRFAATFLRRQGTPLRLAALPAGSGMLGLSYPGGLSRDTTAMLCRVDGQPVMVFVDKQKSDYQEAMHSDDPAIQVFRAEREGLVFYEVTPLEAPRVMEYLLVP